jgi:hypothetical protein
LNKTFLHDRNANFLKKEKDIYAFCAPNATGKSGGGGRTRRGGMVSFKNQGARRKKYRSEARCAG